MIQLAILTGSVRPGRFNIQPATWIYEQAKKLPDINVDLLDLEKIGLPFHDESKPPMMGEYDNDHSKAWSKTIGEKDAYIWVTPEYNHSFSPVLKNAIDFLNLEWNFKPVSIVSYGSLAGGARAAEHLRGVAGELKMYDIREQVLLPNYWENLNDKGQYMFTERHEHTAKEMLQTLVFWGEVMKKARAEMK